MIEIKEKDLDKAVEHLKSMRNRMMEDAECLGTAIVALENNRLINKKKRDENK